MERWQGRVALVTGANAGIGAAIARSLVKSGMIVVGCEKYVDYMKTMSEELDNGPVCLHVVRCDLRKETDIIDMLSKINSQYGGVDVCVNNAGLTFFDGEILNGNTEHWREMLDVNVMALAICTREAIKSMRERNVDDGHIIHIGSRHCFHHSPRASIHWYGATKWMVRAITDCLRMELRAEKSRIKVSAIHPGRVKTDIMQSAYGEKEATEYYKNKEALSADKVAAAVVTTLGTAEEVEIEELIVSPTLG